VLKLIERVDPELPADSPIRADQDYQRMLDHRRIDSFKVIEARLDPELTNASDFSRFSVEARIQAGYDDAKRQGVSWPSASPPPEPQAPPASQTTPRRRPAPRPAARRRAGTATSRDPVLATRASLRPLIPILTSIGGLHQSECHGRVSA
jgi:hypothetical protein